MPYEKINDPDIQAAIDLANQSTQELRGAKSFAREQALDNRSWFDYAGDVGRNLYNMKDVGLFHDVIPGAVRSAGQAITAPGRVYEAGASGRPMSQEQLIEDALNTSGMVTLGAGAIPAEANALRMGIRAYHSSPHDFDKFDLSKIGTGEGAQVYGDGLYFAESPAVSGRGGEYWKNFRYHMPEGFEKIGAYALSRENFDKDAAIARLIKSKEKYALEPTDWLHKEDTGIAFDPAMYDEAVNRLARGEIVGPRTYEVNINAKPESFLNWDKPLSQQSSQVHNVLGQFGMKYDPNMARQYDDAILAMLFGGPEVKFPDEPIDYVGSDIYKRIVKQKNAEGAFGEHMADIHPAIKTGPRAASEALREAGIPGIRYLDAASRGQKYWVLRHPQGGTNEFPDEQSALDYLRKNPEYTLERPNISSNYVVFDPSIIDITRKYAAGGSVNQDADIDAAMQTARQNFEGGGVAINQDQIDQGIISANQSLQELRGAKQAVQDQAASNQSWGDWASQMGKNLYGMKDIGLFHDIIPGAIESVKKAATMPYREQMAAASGQPWTDQQRIGEAFNVAGLLTGGAGVVPVEANSLRAGAGLFSKAERAAAELPMEKMQGPQALAMLTKAGVGPEELKWTGLADRLPAAGALTKDDLLRMIREGDVQLNEVVRGGPASERPTFTDAQTERLNELTEKRLAGTITEAEMAEKNALYQAYEASVSPIIATKFGPEQNPDWSMKGGQNYRETLITLPEAKEVIQEWPVLDFLGIGRGRYTTQEAAEAYARSRGEGFTVGPVIETPVLKGFRSQHWPEQNVLAHIRTNEFAAANPEGGPALKAFNLDELQSDWAQKGRKEGFVDPELNNKIASLEKAISDAEEAAKPYTDQGKDAPRQLVEQWTAAKNQLWNLKSQSTKVYPNAPYVQSTNQWADLGLKKAVSQAIDSGSDVFTWTPGKVNAERYDLSKQVKKIHFLPNDDGTFHVGTELPNGEEFSQASGVMDLEKIEKTFGKEIAKKVKNGEFTGADNNVSYIEGKDLAVGGKGMIDFYDNIIPKRMAEVIRKATGEKPQFQTWTIQTADGPMEVQGFRITPEMKAKLQSFKEKEGGYFSHFADGGKVEDSHSVNKALQIAAEALV